ncbi:hypothetical protein [Nocardia stercoris]|uniref:hypothetical protein n=1 Tax=Nocardia stercoris TaxID=2483361 RepID=UPI001319BEBA|nr:hypothetical protein [Nocardia stercoris]
MGSTALAAASGSGLAGSAAATFGDPAFVGLLTFIGTGAALIGTGIALGPILNPPAAG